MNLQTSHDPAACPFSGSGAAGLVPGDLSKHWDLADPESSILSCQPGAEKEAVDHLARVAWRNSVRCIGRLHWKSLKVEDARSCQQPDEIFEALTRHLQLATGNGNITPVLTLFARWENPSSEIRIWNHQLIRYAAYQGDGEILGDPMNLELTQVALALGWQPPREPSRFDLLPVIIQCGDQLRWYEWPQSAVLEVPIRHRDHPWLEKLGLRWYAVPVLCDRIFATGHEVFPCAPFNGWYMGTEIGARDLADANRYNQLPVIAEKLGLDTRRGGSLWQDHALLLLNEAVIGSFSESGVRLVDHHQASREFIQFCDHETRSGRQASADWSWIVPPISSSATPVFHRTYPMKAELPNFLLQPQPWDTERGRRLLARTAVC